MATGQAERLIPFLEGMLAEAGLGWGDIGTIGVGIGPGNFTGVRIAVAAARGLALGLGLRAVGVSGLAALALGQAGIVATDARRGMAYVQRFDASGPASDPQMVARDGPLPFDPGPAPCFIGDLAALMAARWGGTVADPLFPLPEAIARIARLRAESVTARPAPLYLRGADAAPPRDPPPRIIPA